jgi:hypothetical protein
MMGIAKCQLCAGVELTILNLASIFLSEFETRFFRMQNDILKFALTRR